MASSVGSFARGRRDRRRNNLAISDAQRTHAVIEQVRYDAYEHMTLGDGTLAPIIVDVIRAYDAECKAALAAVGTDAAVYEPDEPKKGPGSTGTFERS